MEEASENRRNGKIPLVLPSITFKNVGKKNGSQNKSIRISSFQIILISFGWKAGGLHAVLTTCCLPGVSAPCIFKEYIE